MKASELRSMTREELYHEMAELREEEFRLRLRRATEDLPNALRLRTIRRDISRIQTLLREDKLGIIKLPSKSGLKPKEDKPVQGTKEPAKKKKTTGSDTKKKKTTTQEATAKPKSTTKPGTSKSGKDKKSASRTGKEKK
jgi:large subunit ribosomal protein L29